MFCIRNICYIFASTKTNTTNKVMYDIDTLTGVLDIESILCGETTIDNIVSELVDCGTVEPEHYSEVLEFLNAVYSENDTVCYLRELERVFDGTRFKNHVPIFDDLSTLREVQAIAERYNQTFIIDCTEIDYLAIKCNNILCVANDLVFGVGYVLVCGEKFLYTKLVQYYTNDFKTLL